MEREIKIFCPKRKCGKCTRLFALVEEAIKISDQAWKMEKIDSLDEIMEYPTWILPTLVINGKVAARGYVPSVKMIVKMLKASDASRKDAEMQRH